MPLLQRYEATRQADARGDPERIWVESYEDGHSTISCVTLVRPFPGSRVRVAAECSTEMSSLKNLLYSQEI